MSIHSAFKNRHSRGGGNPCQATWIKFVACIPACAGMTLIVALGLVNSAFAAEPLQRTITVTGQSERSIAPDEAHVLVNFGATDMKMNIAKTAHDKKLQQVLSIAKEAGIDEAQVKTESSSSQPQYSWDNNKRQFKGYRVQTALDITVKDATKVSGLMDKLSTAGLESGDAQEYGNLLNLSYRISNPDKIRDEMLADAIKNARAKAENMAAAADSSVGKVIQINEGSAPSFMPVARPMMAMAKAGMADSAAAAPPVGEEKVNANVSVVFELQ